MTPQLKADLLAISEQVKTQDNCCTQNPMFCVQIKRRDVGYDSAYSDSRCWHNSANEQTIYDDDADFKDQRVTSGVSSDTVTDGKP